MSRGLASYVARWLESLEPLAPIATGIDARLPRLPDIEAVLFDVYGTLLVSASGDISGMRLDADRAALALRENGILEDAARVKEAFREVVAERHAMSGRAWPEVDVREVWEEVLQRLGRDGPRDGRPASGGESPRHLASRALRVLRLAFAFELAANPVWPMPGLRETLAALAGAGVALGLVSNAQFYTPIVLARFAGRPWPFARDLTVFSYREGRAKPDAALFEPALQGLRLRGLRPAQALFVGNDTRNDVAPAAALGLRTALFAGDRRSLRTRGAPGAGVEPDAVLTSLAQVCTVAGIATGRTTAEPKGGS